VAWSAHVSDRIIAAKLAGERSNHRDIHARGRRRRRSPSPPTARREMSGVGGDHVGIEIPDHRRTPQLLAQPMSKRQIDRRVLPTGPRRRGPGSDPLGLSEQVALRGPAIDGRVDSGRNLGSPLPHLRDPIDDLYRVAQPLPGSER
jgi:hypothetical protein